MSIGLQDISYDNFINNGIYSYYVSENPYLEQLDELAVWENFKETMKGEYNFVDPVPVEEDTAYPPNPDDINIDPNYINQNIKDADIISGAIFNDDYQSVDEAINSTKTTDEYVEPEYMEAYRNGDITKDELLGFMEQDENEKRQAIEEERWNKYNTEKQQYINEYNKDRTFKMNPISFDSSEDGFIMKEKYGLLTENDKVLATLKGYDIGDGKDGGTSLNPFELWVSPKDSGKETAMERVLPENWLNSVKHGLNTGIPGMAYNVAYGDNKYDVPDDYAENQAWSESFLSLMVSALDPTSIASFKAFQLGGQLLSKGLQKTTLYGYSKAQPWISTMMQKYYANHVAKATTKSKWGYKIADFALIQAPKWFIGKVIPTSTTLATVTGGYGTLQSVSDQKMRRGKYVNGDGNINLWDTTVDSYHSARRGAIAGFGLATQEAVLGGFAAWSSSKINPLLTDATGRAQVLTRTQNIQNNIFKGINKIAESPLTKYGTAGYSMNIAGLAFDSETRNMYYDKNGNFAWGRFNRDSFTASGMYLFYTGLYAIPPHISTKVDGAAFRGPRLTRRPDNSFFEELNRNINEAQRFRNHEVNKQNTTDKEEVMVNESVKNIKKNTGIDLKVDFVKQHMDKAVDAVETVEGLLGVHDILTEGHRILMKGAVKNDDGKIIDYDLDNLTDAEVTHIMHILPTAMKALSGYKQNLYETDEGKQEYIDMYEKENNVKLTEGEKKNLINALEKDIERFDLLMTERDKLAKGIHSDSEDIDSDISDGNKSDIDILLKKKNVSVVALGEDGNPILDKNKKIQSFQMDKEDAKEHIKNGNVKLEKDVDYDLELGEKASESPSIGTGASQGQIDAKAIAKATIEEAQRLGLPAFQKPFKSSIHTQEDLENPNLLGENWRVKALQRDLKEKALKDWLANYKDKNGTKALITHPYDIAVLDNIITGKSPSTQKSYYAVMHDLLKFSGKKELTALSKSDIIKWHDAKIKERADKDQIPSLNTNELSALKLVFNKGMLESGYLKTSPIPSAQLTKWWTDHVANQLKKELPPLELFFAISDNIKTQLAEGTVKEQRIGIAFDLTFEFLIRDQEINRLRFDNIKEEKGRYFIDFITPRIKGGIRKKRSTPRIIIISKELRQKLYDIAKQQGIKKPIFPDGSKEITKILQENVPIEEGKPGITTKSIRNQLKALVENEDLKGKLSPTERAIYAVIAGHNPGDVKGAGGTSAIRERYGRGRENIEKIESQQKIVLDKVKELLKESILKHKKEKEDDGTTGGQLKTKKERMKEKQLKSQLAKVESKLATQESRLKQMEDKGKLETVTAGKIQDTIIKLKDSIIKLKDQIKQHAPSIALAAIGAAAGFPIVSLSVKDVSGKDDDVIKNVTEKLSQAEEFEMSREVFDKFVKSVRSVFNDFSKEMTPPEKKEFLEHLVRRAGVTDIEGFKISINTSQGDLLEFAETINEMLGKPKKTVRDKLYWKKQNIIEKTKDLLASHNRPEKEFFHTALKLFGKDYPKWKNDVTKINQYDLSPEELTDIQTALVNEYGPKLDPKHDYIHNLVNESTPRKFLKSITDKEARLYMSGAPGRGQVITVVDRLAKEFYKGGFKETSLATKKVGEDLLNHYIYESMVKNEYEKFLTDVYEIMGQGKWTGVGGTVIRKQKGLTKKGMYEFNKIKDNIARAYDNERFEWGLEHIKNNPDDKKFALQFKAIEKLHWKIYDKKAKDDTGKDVMRIDTIESAVAKRWHQLTTTLKDHVINALRRNMTDEQYKRFIKKYPIKWLTEQLYFPRNVTQELKDNADFIGRDTEKAIRKEMIKEQRTLAEIKYGKNKQITDAQLSEFENEARMRVSTNLLSQLSFTGGAMINARVLFERKLYLGERAYLAKDDKYIDTYEHTHDGYVPGYVAAIGKLSGNIAFFPYLLGMKGLPKHRQNIPSLIEEVHKKGGLMGEMLINIIGQRTGMPLAQSSRWPASFNRFMARANTYVSKANLATPKTSLKNYLYGWRQNSLQYGLAANIYPTFISHQWLRRMDAKGYGIMDMSFTKIQEEALRYGFTYKEISSWKNIFDKSLDYVFDRTRFASTEQMLRTAAVLNMFQELPQLHSGLTSSNKKLYKRALDRAKDFWRLTDNEIEIFKAIGLGDTNVGWTGKAKLLGRDIETLKKERFKTIDDISYIKRNGNVKKISELSPAEKIKLQFDIDLLHQKFITMRHARAHGSTDQLFQPYFMGKKDYNYS